MHKLKKNHLNVQNSKKHKLNVKMHSKKIAKHQKNWKENIVNNLNFDQNMKKTQLGKNCKLFI